MKILDIAAGEIGYLEKKSNSDLDSKTGNAGYNNYTKYGKWYGINPGAWCDMFVSWCADKAGQKDAVGCFAYVPYHVDFFKNRGRYFARGAKTPQAGDVIFFGDADHVGLVEKVSGGYVTTIEGNTSGGSTLISNGGGVCRKRYPLSSDYIMGYGRPDYGEEERPVDDYEVRTYYNGSTEETVYSDTSKNKVIGSLNPWEVCKCLGKADGMYIVLYTIDGTYTRKIGFVEYEGR